MAGCWAAAAEHRLGGGLKDGTDLFVLRKLRRHLCRMHLPDQVGVLDAVASAGMWPLQRRLEAGYLPPPGEQWACCLCKQHPDTELHRVWECPALGESLPGMKVDLMLRRQAVQHAQEGPCLWLRGLPYASWYTAVPEAGDSAETWAVGAFLEYEVIPSELAERWRWYSDGSGGPHGSDPRLRRCGWSLVAIEQHGDGTWQLAAGLFGGAADGPQV